MNNDQYVREPEMVAASSNRSLPSLRTSNKWINEKATRQQGGLFFSRENSSNGALKSVKTFWDKSYESKNGGVKGFL
jgi:hypothetical protein